MITTSQLKPEFVPAGYYQAPQMLSYARLLNPNIPTNALKESLGYRQAGIESQRRMEKAVSMGFPENTDISRIINVGGIPMAPIQQPFGSWGRVGSGKTQSTGEIQAGPALGASGSSGYDLAEQMREEENAKTRPVLGATLSGFGYNQELAQASAPRSTFLGQTSTTELPFTGFGAMARNENKESPSPLGMMNRSYYSQTFVPKFPFKNY
jgi:hypothetical protein